MKRICFVNYDNYPVLNPAFGESYIGGESVQQTFLAREFARRGWQVSMVCGDFGQPDGEVIDDITVWKSYRPTAGLPVVRFVYPRIYSIWRALSRADADIYYQSCAGTVTGVTAYFARSRGKKMIFRVAHDTDCMPGQQLIRFARDRKIYEYGLRAADLICAQSDYQMQLLQDNYDLPSVKVDMVVETPRASDAAEKSIDVLWVNNVRDFKRPDVLCDIAERAADVNFVMIGGPVSGYESMYAEIERRARGIPNLDFVGPVPYADVNDYFEKASLFLNTSDSEGFPNSFLQAWIRGVPVISFFDPDATIERHRLGVSPQGVPDAIAAIRSLLEDSAGLASRSASCRDFGQAHYSAAAVVDRYDRLIDEAALLGAGDAPTVARG